MVKTHLPGHLDSVRQKCRPKHQLLILKCYPRLPKNSAADVKPNGSELSYLLFYASTRKSKLQKVGSFLERKTANDCGKAQSARVLVTLQILTALLENKGVGAGSGFTLVAPYVLRIIRDIQDNSVDISLIEASLATWDVFCRHQDQVTLAADHEYRGLYQDVVKRWAAFARRNGAKTLSKSTHAVAIQDEIRLRKTGLGAIKSVLLSEALASESGRQLELVLPAVLSNIKANDGMYLEHLQRLHSQAEREEKEKNMNRRLSMNTVRTYTNATDLSADADPRQAEGTAQDADDLAEEEVAVLALECLRATFASENRSQVRTAASGILKFAAQQRSGIPPSSTAHASLDRAVDAWAAKLFEICAAWTPVQDRFILMVTAVETLVRLPLEESELRQQLLYTSLIDHLLRSDLNLIGLSVMDVLLSLIQQILRVLQLSGPPVPGRSSVTQLFSSQEELKQTISHGTDAQTDGIPSEPRMRLVARLKDTIADLGTHVYYTDQISDMISAILLRLKPNPTPAGQHHPLATAAAIEEPKSAVVDTASNVSISARESSHAGSGGFFSFDTARQIALDAVRDIIHVANSARTISMGGVAEGRNSVPITIWEGTQWLLRDPSPNVRRAYINALSAWLGFETKKNDFRVKIPVPARKKKAGADGNVLARRAVSNASTRERGQSKKATNTFLQLLHLAIYDSTLQFATVENVVGEREFLALHALLISLTQKLGINAVAVGLPMMFALQDEATTSDSSVVKMRVGSLVLGYLWNLVEVFDLDTTLVGRDINSEVSRRKQLGAWIQTLTVPPMPLEHILVIASSGSPSNPTLEPDAIRPFEQRQAVIDCVAEAYETTNITSPPASPPVSPARHITTPAPERKASFFANTKISSSDRALPANIKDALSEPWTREGCLAAIAAAAPRSASLTASRRSPNTAALARGNHRQLLSAADSAPSSRQPSLPHNAASLKQKSLGAAVNSQSPERGRPGAVTDGISSRNDSSSRSARVTVKVDDLKRVLATGGPVAFVTRMRVHSEDTGSESMVDVEDGELGSDSGFATPPRSATSGAPEPLAATEHGGQEQASIQANTGRLSTEEPPILRLANDTITGGRLSETDDEFKLTSGSTAVAKRPVSQGRASIRSKKGGTKKDVKALLANIGDEREEMQGVKIAGAEERTFSGVGKPPY